MAGTKISAATTTAPTGTDMIPFARVADTTPRHVTINALFDRAIVINESGADVDFRAEGSSNINCIYLDAGNDNVTINATAVSANYDLMLAGDGVLGLKEATTPSADLNYGKIYCKNDNMLYFQDGAGTEKRHVVLSGDTMTGNLTMNGGNIVMTAAETVDGVDISAWIDQDVGSGSSPTLDGSNITGIPDGAMDTDYVEVGGDTMTGDLLIQKSSPVLTIQSTDATDSLLWFKANTLGNSLKFYLDESASADDLIVAGQTASVDTSFRVIAQDGEQALLSLYSGGTNYSQAYVTAGDNFLLQNTTEDKDIVFYINDGGSNTAVLRIDGDVSRVGICSTTPGALLDIDGKVDEVQLQVDAHSTQTSNTVAITNSSGDEVLTILDDFMAIGNITPDSRFKIADTGNAGTRGLVLENYEGATAAGAAIILKKSRNSTMGSHTIVQDGDVFGVFGGYGSDGDSWEIGCTLKFFCDGTPGDGDMPGAFSFFTRPSGGGNTERARFTSNGNFLLGTTTDVSANGGKVMSFGDNGADPTMGSNVAGIYAKDVGGTVEMWVVDEADNASQISPHDPETGEWIFYSKNVRTGKEMKVNMEQMVQEIERLTGKKFMYDSYKEN